MRSSTTFLSKKTNPTYALGRGCTLSVFRYLMRTAKKIDQEPLTQSLVVSLLGSAAHKSSSATALPAAEQEHAAFLTSQLQPFIKTLKAKHLIWPTSSTNKAAATTASWQQVVRQLYKSRSSEIDAFTAVRFASSLEAARFLCRDEALRSKCTKQSKKNKPSIVKSTAPAPGTLLVSHPMLTDEFAQAIALMIPASVNIDRNRSNSSSKAQTKKDQPTRAIVLNQPLAGHMGDFLATSVIEGGAKNANFDEITALLKNIPIYNGGVTPCEPVLIHSMPVLEHFACNGRSQSKVDLEAFQRCGCWVTSLRDIIARCPLPILVNLLGSCDSSSNLRIAINYIEWKSSSALSSDLKQGLWGPMQHSAKDRNSDKAVPLVPWLLAKERQGFEWNHVFAAHGKPLDDFSAMKPISEIQESLRQSLDQKASAEYQDELALQAIKDVEFTATASHTDVVDPSLAIIPRGHQQQLSSASLKPKSSTSHSPSATALPEFTSPTANSTVHLQQMLKSSAARLSTPRTTTVKASKRTATVSSSSSVGRKR